MGTLPFPHFARHKAKYGDHLEHVNTEAIPDGWGGIGGGGS